MTDGMIKKTQVLLSGLGINSGIRRSNTIENERYLVSWVLLTRLSRNEINIIWKNDKNRRALSEFAEKLLLSFVRQRQEQQKEHQQLNYLYLRIIAQVTSRMDTADYPYDIGIALYQAWKSIMIISSHNDNKDDKGDMIELHIDVCRSINVWLNKKEEEDESTTKLTNHDSEEIMATIWNTYISNHHQHHSSAPIVPSSKTKNIIDTTSKTIENEKKKNEMTMMYQTLKAILQQKDNLPQQEQIMTKAWNEIVLEIFQFHGRLPNSLLPSILNWIITSSQCKTLIQRFSWHEWFLNLLHHRIITPSSSFKRTFLQNHITMKHLNNFLLAHAVSPHNMDDSNSLRSAAWHITIAMIESFGWSWMFPPKKLSSNNNETLGDAKMFCTWTRLASGEWRIQLESEIGKVCGINNTIFLEQERKELPAVGDACARMLINAVQFCAQLDNDDATIMMSSFALLHLRQSLEHTLWTTVEYLQWCCIRDNNNVGNNNKNINDDSTLFTTSIQLFGTLLMDIDIWDLMKKTDEHLTPQDIIIECLVNLLPLLKDRSLLLPGLVNILTNTEKKQNQLGPLFNNNNILVNYLEDFWKQQQQSLLLADNKTKITQLNDTIAWACSCTELWADLSTSNDDNNNKRRLAIIVLKWIQTMLLQKDKSKAASCISLAVGCYMALSKDQKEPPKEQEYHVIVSALKFCESL